MGLFKKKKNKDKEKEKLFDYVDELYGEQANRAVTFDEFQEEPKKNIVPEILKETVEQLDENNNLDETEIEDTAVSSSTDTESLKEPEQVFVKQNIINDILEKNQQYTEMFVENNFHFKTLDHKSVSIIDYQGEDTTVIIPDTVKDKKVVRIEPYSFSKKNINKVIIPGSVKEIENHAFYASTSLIDVEFNDGTTRISSFAFAKTGLIHLSLPYSIRRIGEYSFLECDSLKDVVLSGVEVIKNGAFKNCKKLANVEFSDRLKDIGSFSFQNCEMLSAINIGNNVNTIGDLVFKGCKNMETIFVSTGNMKFSSLRGLLYNYNESLLIYCPEAKENIELSESLRVIGDYALCNCKMEHLTLPQNCKKMGIGAISNCRNLKSLTLPKIMRYLKPYAITNNPHLKEIIIEAGYPPYGMMNAVCLDRKTTKIYVPKEALDIYKNDMSWHYYKDSIVPFEKKIED